MKALVKDHQVTCVEDREIPTLDPLNTVLIHVQLTGVCRTDINVATGRMPSADVLVLGHEFYGEIADVHPTVQQFAAGQKVTVDPSRFGRNQDLMCGVDVDGAFAEYIKVPEHTVFSLPDALSPEASAFIEPVAASLAVLKANLDREARGCIYGDNRIAHLTRKIMQLHGYDNVTLHPQDEPIVRDHYDYIVETVSRTEDFDRMITAVRPGGKIVLKSRQVRPIELLLHTLVKKEITMQAVHYGDFGQAIELVTSGRLDLSDLFGETFPLEDYAQAFSESQRGEARKCYLKV
jgi:L-iditol 2-dehydrogenase